MNTSFLLGRPIFRCELLVSGSVFLKMFNRLTHLHDLGGDFVEPFWGIFGTRLGCTLSNVFWAVFLGCF